MDNRIKKLAEVLLKYSLDIKEGEKIAIVGDVVTLPLIKESYRLAVGLGALPQVMINSEELKEILLKGGNDEQIKYVPDSVKKAFETVDVVLSFFGGSNTRMLSNVDPEKLKLTAQGSSEITKIFFERVAKEEVEDSVEGHIRFSFPGIYGGREIEDIQLAFERGKVIKATAAKGQELLKQLLKTDKGARFVGEIAAGTNYNIEKFTRHMLFDEKIGGTVHLAIGRSIPESLGKNQSAIHWDMLCDMRKGGKIYADGELIYKYGKFLI